MPRQGRPVIAGTTGTAGSMSLSDRFATLQRGNVKAKARNVVAATGAASRRVATQVRGRGGRQAEVAARRTGAPREVVQQQRQTVNRNAQRTALQTTRKARTTNAQAVSRVRLAKASVQRPKGELVTATHIVEQPRQRAGVRGRGNTKFHLASKAAGKTKGAKGAQVAPGTRKPVVKRGKAAAAEPSRTDLDADLDSYFGRNPLKSKLDDDLDSYWSVKSEDQE